MNILVIEDEPKLAELIRQGLDEDGYNVDVAHDGQSGLDKALKNPFDLVIMDVIMPIMNGVEVCRIIRNEKPELPVIMLTALDTIRDKQNGFEAGADDYIV